MNPAACRKGVFAPLLFAIRSLFVFRALPVLLLLLAIEGAILALTMLINSIIPGCESLVKWGSSTVVSTYSVTASEASSYSSTTSQASCSGSAGPVISGLLVLPFQGIK